MRMKKIMKAAAILMIGSSGIAQVSPAISSWVINTSGATGYNCPTCPTPTYGSIPADVQSVYYTGTDVYVKSQGIPSYNVGPWNSNPNIPSAQNKTWKFTLNPTQNTGTKTSTGLGAIGVWSNGMVMFNPMDGYYWNNTTNSVSTGVGTWNRNAYVFEGISFDACLGHPNQTGTYHNHVIPKCLFSYSNTAVHSPIVGYAFDGYPVYGPYGYANSNGTGGIKRMVSSYSLTTATTRVNGPSMTTTVMINGSPNTYYAGTFNEDYVYTAGYGDLDQYNGRFCVTPEYPGGTYAYFITLDASNNPAYPYIVGPQYYGTVAAGNTGPSGGSNSVPGTATQYTPATTSVSEFSTFNSEIKVFPNPIEDHLLKFEIPDNSYNLTVKVLDYQGRVLINRLYHAKQYQNSIELPLEYLSAGIYILNLESGSQKMVKRIMVMED